MVRPFDELMNAYIGDVLVKEALGTLLVIANDVLVTLGLKPGAETKLNGCERLRLVQW